MAQYLNSIYHSSSERSDKLVIENKAIRVDENCGLFLFLTDSESHEKAELSDQLKRLFRYWNKQCPCEYILSNYHW